MFKSMYSDRKDVFKKIVAKGWWEDFLAAIGLEKKKPISIGERARIIQQIDQGLIEAEDVESHMMRMATVYEETSTAFGVSIAGFDRLLDMVDELEDIAPTLWNKSPTLRNYSNKTLEPIVNRLIAPMEEADDLYQILDASLNHLYQEVTSGKNKMNRFDPSSIPLQAAASRSYELGYQKALKDIANGVLEDIEE